MKKHNIDTKYRSQIVKDFDTPTRNNNNNKTKTKKQKQKLWGS